MPSSPIIKLISLNIEGDKHFETVIPFLLGENADIICLQEVYEKDLDLLKEKLEYGNFFFAPMTVKENNIWGTATLSRHPLTLLQKTYYAGSNETIPTFDMESKTRSVLRVLMTVGLIKDTISFVVGNTHFTWTPDGNSDETQRCDMSELLKALAKNKEIVFCCDFNAPRGRDMWTQLAEHYTDNIPPHITNTLDPMFHRAPEIVRLVDGIFSTPGYRVQNVIVRNGISDHCAIVGEITKNS